MVTKTIYLFILSLFGVVCGFIVSMIAIEELKSGKKYFFYLKYALLFCISVFFIWQTVIFKQFITIAIYILLLIGIFLLNKKYHTLRIEAAYYVLFFVSIIYLDVIGVSFNLLIVFATLIALYGFVPGTFLHIRLLEGKKRKYR